MSDAVSTLSSAAVNPVPYGLVCGWVLCSPALQGVGVCMSPWELHRTGTREGRSWEGAQVPRGAGWETPSPGCRDGLPNCPGVTPGAFPPPSSQTTLQTPGTYFPFTFTFSPPASVTKDNNEEPGPLPFPKRITIQLRAGLGAPQPLGPHVTACGEPGDGIAPTTRSCPSRSPLGAGTEPSSVPPPGKCCGKH